MACSKDLLYSNQDESIVTGYDFKQVEVDKALECPICMMMLRQTMGTLCSHLFCLVCVQKLTGRRDIRGTSFKCPVCKSIVNTDRVFPIVYMDRCVRGSNVYCQQHKEGCKWKGALAEYLNKHEKECEFKVVTCKHERCKVSAMRRIMMKDHELHCPFRIVQCNHCTVKVRENELNEHYQSCEKFPTNCKENGCNALVPKNEMEDHLSICDYVNVNCSYMPFGCMEKVNRKNVENHIEINTQQHMMFICKKYYSMEETLRNTTKQIEIQSAKIENQNAEIVKQNTKIEKQNTKIEKQNTEIQKQRSEIEKLKTDNATQTVNIENQEKEIEQLKRKAIDINESLLKGADRWIRKKEISFDENVYAVWFQKIFDLMIENKLYRYHNTMYVKLKNKNKQKLCWSSNNKYEQENRSRNKDVIYKCDELLLLKMNECLYIDTVTLDGFKHTNSSLFILNPHQQRKIVTGIKGTNATNFNEWKTTDFLMDDFYVNNFLIVCLMTN